MIALAMWRLLDVYWPITTSELDRKTTKQSIWARDNA